MPCLVYPAPPPPTRIAVASHAQQDIWTRYCIGLLSHCRCDIRLGHQGGSCILRLLVAAVGFHLVSRGDRSAYRHSRQTPLRPNNHRDARVYGDARWLAVSRGLFAVVGISAGAVSRAAQQSHFCAPTAPFSAGVVSACLRSGVK